MALSYFSLLSYRRAPLLAGAGLLALGTVLGCPAAAQSGPKPTWLAALVGTGGSTANTSQVLGMATDASGNVVVVGSFVGTVTFGSTTLTSAGADDAFVAKYLTATDTWAWAVRAGGTAGDAAGGVAVRGTSIYVAGTLTNSRANVAGVTFGTAAQYGASSFRSADVFLAKYTDAGSSVALGWTQVAGGAANDYGTGVAVNATTSSVYVTGLLANDQANSNTVVFGGSGTAAGTSAQAGAAAGSFSDDLFVAKYIDNGTVGAFGWSQVGGGIYSDQGNAVAASGNSVYVVGTFTNTTSNAGRALFGGSGTAVGTAQQLGTGPNAYSDVVLAKYTDNGFSGVLGWTQVAGGTDADYGQGVAASSSGVYVTGNLYNSAGDDNLVRFGGSGLVAGTVVQTGIAGGLSTPDLFLAKYNDNGSSASVGWTQIAGGSGTDNGAAVAVSGNRVYVVGYAYNNSAGSNGVVFGGSGRTQSVLTQPGATSTSSNDLVAAGYLDNGASASVAWSQVGGGPRSDLGYAVAVAGTRLYVGGTANAPAFYGPLTITTPANAIAAFVGALNLTATLATAAPALAAAPQLAPNPASGSAVLSGAAPATTGQVLDALGRAVATFRTDAAGAATLPAGLAPGLYLVRVGAATVRWVVQ